MCQPKSKARTYEQTLQDTDNDKTDDKQVSEEQTRAKKRKLCQGLTADELLRPTLHRPFRNSSSLMTEVSTIHSHKPREKSIEDNPLQLVPIRTVDMIPVNEDDLECLFQFFDSYVSVKLPHIGYEFWFWDFIMEPFWFLVPSPKPWVKISVSRHCWNARVEMCCYLLLQVTGSVEESIKYLHAVTQIDLPLFINGEKYDAIIFQKLAKHYVWIDHCGFYETKSISRDDWVTDLQTRFQEQANSHCLKTLCFPNEREAAELVHTHDNQNPGDQVQISEEHEAIGRWIACHTFRYQREVKQPTQLAMTWTLDRCFFGPAAFSYECSSDQHLVSLICSFVNFDNL